jgi:hypothetical protein
VCVCVCVCVLWTVGLNGSTTGRHTPSIYSLTHRATRIYILQPVQDKRIPQEKRERFEALDLEVLLSEFRAVAVMAQGKADEEEGEEREIDTSPGADEIEWLREAGFPSLADTHLGGTKIEEAEVFGLIEVLSPEMAVTVRKRVSFLNGLLLGGAGGDAGGAAASASRQNTDPLDIPTSPRSPTSAAKTPPRSPPTTSPRRSVSEHGAQRRTPRRSTSDDDAPTRFDDLGEGDRAQLQYLNVVHLTTILESKKIFKISKTTHKNKMKKGTEVCSHLTVSYLIHPHPSRLFIALRTGCHALLGARTWLDA